MITQPTSNGEQPMKAMKTVSYAACLIAMTVWCANASAATVLDVTFDHLSDLSEGAQVPDARRAQDESGNRHHGFYSGGGGSVDVTYLTPTGTAGADFIADGSGGVIIRDALADGGSGSPNPWYGAGSTPVEPTIGASDSWTIEAIINFRGTTGTESIIANNGTGSEWWWRANGGNLQFLFKDSGGGGDAISTTVSATHTVTGGALIGTTAFTSANFDAIGNATRDIEIGQFDGTSTRDFDGLMDRVVISDSILGPGTFAAAIVPTPAALPAGLALMGVLAMRRRR